MISCVHCGHVDEYTDQAGICLKCEKIVMEYNQEREVKE